MHSGLWDQANPSIGLRDQANPYNQACPCILDYGIRPILAFWIMESGQFLQSGLPLHSGVWDQVNLKIRQILTFWTMGSGQSLQSGLSLYNQANPYNQAYPCILDYSGQSYILDYVIKPILTFWTI